MPRNRSKPRPPVMTWAKAVPVMAVAAVCDGARLFFHMFWFFGPLLAGTIVGTIASSYVGSFIGAGVGAAVTIAGGAFGAGVFVFLGVILGMAVGLLGWLSVVFLLFWTNIRMFSANSTSMLWLVLGFAVSEVPFIGAIPALSGTVWKLYRAQIQSDKAAYAAWQEEERKREHELRNQEAILVLEAELASQQSTEEELMAANDNEEIPEEERRVA